MPTTQSPVPWRVSNSADAVKPFNTVHHPNKSEDPQDEDDIQDLLASVFPRYIRTGIII